MDHQEAVMQEYHNFINGKFVTSSGKTRRCECRELFLQERLPALAQWRAEPATQLPLRKR